MNILIIFKEIWRGKDLYRMFMNEECEHHTIRGKVLDIGSGIKLASYHRFLKKNKDTVVECLDLGFENFDGKQIDLETDYLPHQTDDVDSVLLFNVLEHLYNYSLILSEIKRVLKPGSQLIGAVPFLVAYHPDPHDYWRFTKESLEKIFISVGFFNVQIGSFGYGPCTAAFAQFESVLPRLFKLLCVPLVLAIDWLIIKLRPHLGKDRYALGLFFSCSK